jgi:hypothetical protein
MGVSFFTPVTYQNQSRFPIAWIADQYFYLRGKEAYVIHGYNTNGREAIVFSEKGPSYLLSAVKVASYVTIIIPVFFLIVKAFSRCNKRFYQFDVKAALNGDLELDSRLQGRVQEFLSPPKDGGAPKGEVLSPPQGENIVFFFPESPKLVFKARPKGSRTSLLEKKGGKWFETVRVMHPIECRFQNMLTAIKICLVYELNLLRIPQAQIFSDSVPFIVEEKLEINKKEVVQEGLYRESAQIIDAAVHQLAIFIIKTGFSDVSWRNIPLITNSSCIALIDLEAMGNPNGGILGDPSNGSRGLVHCLFNDRQIDHVLAIAQREGIITHDEAQHAKEYRMAELAFESRFMEFCKKKGVLHNPKQSITVADAETLGLNLNEQIECRVKDGAFEAGYRSETLFMRDALEGIVGEINRLIQSKDDDEPIQTKRCVLLTDSNDAITKYGPIYDFQAHLPKILQALVTRSYLFDYLVSARGYQIWA